MKGGEKAMGPNERRKEIIEVLCKRRHDTMKNLAFEFGVSDRTIRESKHYAGYAWSLDSLCI